MKHASFRFAFIVRFADGMLSVFIAPISIFSYRLEEEAGPLNRPSNELATLTPGCVYSVKDLPAAPCEIENE